MITKKKIIMTLGLGGLVLTAPLAAFAFGKQGGFDRDSDFTSELINEPNYEIQLEKLEKTIERKIEQANLILETAELDEDTLSELNDIIAEYSELEVYLEDADLTDEQVEDLKELFLDYKEEATSLTTEFRTIIHESLTDEEIEELKETIGSQKRFENELNDEGRGRGPHFTVETLQMIDPNLAEEFKNGEIYEEEVAEAVKEIMDSMTQEEREELINSMPEPQRSDRPMRGMINQ